MALVGMLTNLKGLLRGKNVTFPKKKQEMNKSKRKQEFLLIKVKLGTYFAICPCTCTMNWLDQRTADLHETIANIPLLHVTFIGFVATTV
jgi:hypothetical protein